MAKCKVCGGSGGYNVAVDYHGEHKREYGNICVSCYACKRPTKRGVCIRLLRKVSRWAKKVIA
jgi:hypothetical protein